MSFELPLLRIGMAGFSLEQQEMLGRVLPHASPGGLTWEFSKFGEADALWLYGGRTQILSATTLRIASGVPAGRSVQINMPDVDRPMVFARPLPRNLQPELAFDLEDPESVGAVLGRLETWLRPTIAQFCLASQVLEQESALGSGVYHVTALNGTLIAVVDLRGDAAVLPTASPMDFVDAMWTARPRDAKLPDQFTHTSLSQLMWHYALRTVRDVLPRRYRTEMLYFRRPPRLPQRLLRDSHLLLLRELSMAPGTFAELQQRTGLVGVQLAQDLAALYLVGAITSNPKRASQASLRRAEGSDSSLYSQQPSQLPASGVRDSRGSASRLQPHDFTAPAPLSFD
ncbi:hypothetical protein [Ramlibacter sp. Leaf400]|uniref:hypothetical protein n=1 Tax=Ramlibacter sp. Leaf400 TaxID=1736365 RepID=UPI000700FA54|nr:hypothetical protein [Ramlibacter sp. Leaf400]KQT08903.1 hypothetical protein ASG30_15590 [Ramlibacter sp. Leaf400]